MLSVRIDNPHDLTPSLGAGGAELLISANHDRLRCTRAPAKMELRQSNICFERALRTLTRVALNFWQCVKR